MGAVLLFSHSREGSTRCLRQKSAAVICRDFHHRMREGLKHGALQQITATAPQQLQFLCIDAAAAAAAAAAALELLHDSYYKTSASHLATCYKWYKRLQYETFSVREITIHFCLNHNFWRTLFSGRIKAELVSIATHRIRDATAKSKARRWFDVDLDA